MHHPPPTGDDRPDARGLGRLLVASLGIVLGLLTAYGPGESPRVADRDPPPGPPNPNVHVALHLDEDLDPGRTSVWTAAFQAVWDRLADEMGLSGGITLETPARPEAVAALNAGRLPADLVDPAELTAIVGRDDEATWSRIRRVSDRPRPTHQRAPSDLQSWVVYARLRSSLRYATPFFPADEPVAFGAAGSEIRAWGIPADATGAAPEGMRDQVRLHLAPGAAQEDAGTRGVVVLAGQDGKRLVLSMRPPRRTLRATWEAASGVMRTTEPRRLSVVDSLTVPRIALVAERFYDEIAPAVFENVDAKLVAAQQHLTLTVDERGADVDAEAVLVGYVALPLRLVFDRPFLVALLAPDRDEPYVLAWIGSADALTPWSAEPGRRMTPDEVRPFAGSWSLDERASIDATAATWRRLLDPRESRDLAEQVGGHLGGRAFELVVAEGGDATVASDVANATPKTATTALRRDGARILLPLPWGDRGVPWVFEVSRDGERLLLRLPRQGLVLVLRPRAR